MAAIRKRRWTTAAGEERTGWTVDFTDANGKRHWKQFALRREADAYRVEIEGKLKAGTFRPDASRITVAELVDAYLEHVEGRQKRGERFTAQHLAVVRGHLKNYVAPSADHAAKRKRKGKSRVTPFTDGVGGVKLAQLTARAVGDFRDRVRDAGVSVMTTRKILASLSAALEYAIGQDWLAVNAAKGVKVIGRRDEGAKKIVPPSKATVKALLGEAGDDFKVKLLVAVATGVRAGELHALRWKHLDLKAATATIETRVDRFGDEDTTKTAAGVRTIPLSAALVASLKAWKLRSKWKKADDLVFPNGIGGYFNHNDMVKRKYLPLFDALAKKGVKVERTNWHALRHFAISTWIEAGLAPKTVQTLAGHSTLSVTMDRYGHLFPSDNHKAAMDSIAKGILA